MPADPLPSWNDGATKARLVDFVTRVTRDETPDFVRAGERIAIFDNDGTLWPEQPVCIQFIFVFDRLKTLAADRPDLTERQPFRKALQGGLDAVAALDANEMIEIIKATQSGMGTEQFSSMVDEWLATARHPRFKRRYTDLVYQPMRELLDYLGRNAFKIFIVSGTGADFIRVFAEEIYGIPPEQVVGSTTVTEFQMSKVGPQLIKIPEVEVVSNGPGKPVAIERFIGRRPIFAFGNSDGDKEMLEWTRAGSGPRFVGLVHHTDADREWAYDRNSKVGTLSTALDLARSMNWAIADMARDWKRIFPEWSRQTAGR